MKNDHPLPRRRAVAATLAMSGLFAVLFAPSLRAQNDFSGPYDFTTFAGSGIPGTSDGSGTAASFSFPALMAFDSARNLYVADGYNQTIRKISPEGIVTTVAGMAGVIGARDGTTTTARFHGPVGVAVDRSGNLYVTEAGNGAVRKITPDGIVMTLAAAFKWPWGVVADDDGNLFVVDLGQHVVRKITPVGEVTTFAGVVDRPGSDDGVGSDARFSQPTALIWDGAGNLLVSDFGNSAVRKITPDRVVTTYAGSLGSKGSRDGTLSEARFHSPAGLAIDPMGNVYVVDAENANIRKISPAGRVTTIAGLAGRIGHANGTGEQARFNFPTGLALDDAGILYVADSDNNVIRRSVPPLAVTVQPALHTAKAGSSVQIAADVTSELPVQLQWRVGGIDLPGATGASLELNPVRVENAGNYSLVVTSSAGSVTSAAASLTVDSNVTTSRLSNISVRTTLLAGKSATVGLATAGGARDVVIRAVGPTLIPLGVTTAVLDPRLELFYGETLVLTNDDWPAALSPMFASIGAFALAPGGRDAAFRHNLNGAYSIQAHGSGPGVILVEAYAAGDNGSSRLINLSAKNRVGTGDDVLIAGFTVSGTGATQLMIRAVGPGLARSGAPGRLSDPKLELFDRTGRRIGENDNWPASLAAIFGLVGAFELPVGSRDAALVTALSPGAYTVQVKGADSGSGEALLEIYEVR